MSFKNWPIIVKIVALLCTLGALAGFASFYAGSKMRGIDDAYKALVTQNDRAVALTLRANKYVSDIMIWIQANAVATDDSGNHVALHRQKAAIENAKKTLSDASSLVAAYHDDIEKIKADLIVAFTDTCAETVRLANDDSSKDNKLNSQNQLTDICQPALAKINQRISEFDDRIIADSNNLSEQLSEATNTTILINYAIVSASLVLVMTLAVIAAIFGISRPIKALTRIMVAMSQGNLSQRVPGVDRKDEIGLMAKTAEQFRLGLEEAERIRELATQTEAQNAEAMTRARNQIADQFQAKMGALADAFAKSSAEVSEAARNLSETADETSRQAQAVTGAAAEASANVQTIAASTEEMSASIREIAGQVSRSSEVANVAAQEAARTESDVKALSEAASKIGEVVDLINTIAGQTNLLALNATIEAARAGEAGRGFAVVASEVKQLAAQTARATEEIGSKINEIQSATNRTVGSIDRIVGTVSQIQSISTAIASAIEEQGAATGEISSNTQLAARGTEGVTNNINGVGRAAEMTGSASSQLMGLSSHLSDQASDLQREVVDFVRQLRAG